MFDILTFMLNFSDKGNIQYKRMETGNVYGQISFAVDSENVSTDIEANDVFEFFIKLAQITGEKIDYLTFKKEFGSLITIDKLELKNSGECKAFSTARKVCFIDKYDEHCNFLNYINALKDHIENFYSEESYFIPLDEKDGN